MVAGTHSLSCRLLAVERIDEKKNIPKTRDASASRALLKVGVVVALVVLMVVSCVEKVVVVIIGTSSVVGVVSWRPVRCCGSSSPPLMLVVAVCVTKCK